VRYILPSNWSTTDRPACLIADLTIDLPSLQHRHSPELLRLRCEALGLSGDWSLPGSRRRGAGSAVGGGIGAVLVVGARPSAFLNRAALVHCQPGVRWR
jgi:hypothetical protein